jgi:hypothetical protein
MQNRVRNAYISARVSRCPADFLADFVAVFFADEDAAALALAFFAGGTTWGPSATNQ